MFARHGSLPFTRSHLRNSADVARGRRAYRAHMELNIEFEATDPPEGWARPATSAERVRFDGWLGLIRSIEELIHAAASRVTSTHPSIDSSGSTDRIGPSVRGEEQG